MRTHWLEIYYPRSIGSAILGPRWAASMISLLQSVGMPQKAIPYMLAQMALETDGGHDINANTYHNWSGIKCNNHGLTSGCATSGNFKGFATYDTDKNWASDYKRVLSLSPGRPIDATSAQDFHNRLLKNDYYGTTIPGNAIDKKYASAFNSRLTEINKILADQSGDLAVQAKDLKKNNPMLNIDKNGLLQDLPGNGFFAAHPLVTGIAAATGVILIMRSISQ